MKGKKWKVQNWRLFCSLLVSYLTILIIPIMGLFIYYVYSSYTLRSEILSKQQSLLTRLQSEMDLRFSSIYSVNDYLASSVDVQDAGKYQADTNLDELFDTLEVQDLLRSTKVTLESYDTFIYFRKSCSVLSTYRRYRKEYLDTYASNYGLTVQEFIDAVSTTSYREHKIVYTDDNIAQLFFMRAIYVGKENIGSVVTVVPIKSIGQLLENSEWLKDWDCYILSSTDSLLIGGNENRINSINLQAFTQNETLLVIPTEEGEYLGSCVDSTLGVWKYAVCTPKEVAMEKQYALRTFIILDFVFSIFLGLFMSLTMSRRHYTPLQKITETLSHNAREYACLNDLPDVVNNVIVSIKKENQRMEHELYKQYTVLKNQILNRILLGQYGDRASVCQALQKFDPEMRDSPCTVVLFYPKEIENSIFAEPVSEGRKTEKMLFFDLMYSSCENVISEMLFAKECKGVAGHFDGKICIILQGSFLETDKEKYRKLLQEIADFHREVLKIRLCVFMAAPCDSFAGLPDCYQHAMELKGIKKFWGDELDDIVFENEILGKQGMWIGGNTTVQKRLINLLIVRDFVSARQLIQNELFRHYDKDANSLSHTRLNIMSMVSMVVDAVADGGTEKDECFCQSLHLDTRLYGAQSAQQLKQETLKLLDQVVEYNERKECGEQPGWIIKVRNFIEEHYADSMLDVSMIAQTFELNVSYMSRTFKKYIGVGILEYIHQVRLQHGKKMLVGGASVRETAEQCGYIDSKALIRAFKRYEGVTPGQWSEMQNGGK